MRICHQESRIESLKIQARENRGRDEKNGERRSKREKTQKAQKTQKNVNNNIKTISKTRPKRERQTTTNKRRGRATTKHGKGMGRAKTQPEERNLRKSVRLLGSWAGQKPKQDHGGQPYPAEGALVGATRRSSKCCPWRMPITSPAPNTARGSMFEWDSRP